MSKKWTRKQLAAVRAEAERLIAQGHRPEWALRVAREKVMSVKRRNKESEECT